MKIQKIVNKLIDELIKIEGVNFGEAKFNTSSFNLKFNFEIESITYRLSLHHLDIPWEIKVESNSSFNKRYAITPKVLNNEESLNLVLKRIIQDSYLYLKK